MFIACKIQDFSEYLRENIKCKVEQKGGGTNRAEKNHVSNCLRMIVV